MIFRLLGPGGKVLLEETYFSIGGGFISMLAEIHDLVAPLRMESGDSCPYGFDLAHAMLAMAEESGLSISDMKRANELTVMSARQLDEGLDSLWQAMRRCVDQGLGAEGVLPSGLELARPAKGLHEQLKADPGGANVNDWLCAYAMAVNEEIVAFGPGLNMLVKGNPNDARINSMAQ